MGLILQLGNEANWNNIYFATTNAAQISQGRFARIPTITVPTQLESPILAVYISCLPDTPTWYFGGWLNQKIFTGLTVGGSPDAENVQRRKIWLNKITIIRLDKLSNNYSITFEVPKWFQSVSIQVWEYIGLYEDSTELLIEELRDDVLRVEQKLDDIATYGGN